MSVLHRCWNLDRPRDVVVSIAKLVSEQLDFSRVLLLNLVIDNNVMSWAHYSLVPSSCLADEVKVVGFRLNNARVNNCTR